ncbi:MAG TPA: hypothetical protein VHV82_11685, partial [Sporichthyaceae bacterium]|nr:hypothetical protein [Sporichthyaceae bacterium]
MPVRIVSPAAIAVLTPGQVEAHPNLTATSTGRHRLPGPCAGQVARTIGAGRPHSPSPLDFLWPGRGDHEIRGCPCGRHTATVVHDTNVSRGVVVRSVHDLSCLAKG